MAGLGIGLAAGPMARHDHRTKRAAAGATTSSKRRPMNYQPPPPEQGKPGKPGGGGKPGGQGGGENVHNEPWDKKHNRLRDQEAERRWRLGSGPMPDHVRDREDARRMRDLKMSEAEMRLETERLTQEGRQLDNQMAKALFGQRQGLARAEADQQMMQVLQSHHQNLARAYALNPDAAVAYYNGTRWGAGENAARMETYKGPDGTERIRMVDANGEVMRSPMGPVDFDAQAFQSLAKPPNKGAPPGNVAASEWLMERIPQAPGESRADYTKRIWDMANAAKAKNPQETAAKILSDYYESNPEATEVEAQAHLQKMMGVLSGVTDRPRTAPAAGLGAAGLSAPAAAPPATAPPADQITLSQAMRGAQPAPARPGTDGNPVAVGSPAEARQLPPGTVFRTPDGRVMRVPQA